MGVDRFGNPHALNLSYARGAILSSLVDLTFTDLRQLADVAAGLCDTIRRHGLCRITGELVEAVEYRAARECVEGYDGLAPEAARERGRLFPAGVGSGIVSFATSAVFDAERDVRLRVAVASGS